MKLVSSICAAMIVCSASAMATAQDPPASDQPTVAMTERERAFAERVTGAQLVGSFSLDGQPADQPLREDRYEIVSARKVGEVAWQVEARIGYSQSNKVFTIPIELHWAGDSPVISVNSLSIPPIGTYDARIVFLGDQYAGVWSGGVYGGKMFGSVVRPEPSEDDDKGAVDNDDEAAARQSNIEAPPNWPQFRGAGARGIADGHSPPHEWNVETGENILWKTPIDGLAHSSPVIWGDRLFVTSAVALEGDQALKVGLYGAGDSVDDEGAHRFVVMCLDRHTGDVLWQHVAYEGVPKVKRHPKASHANSTPATDGRHIVAFFGSEGLYCYSIDGALLWKRDFGVLNAGAPGMPGYEWGFASSPVIHKDMVIVQCDVQDQSFVTALDITDGSDIWRTNRDEPPTWGSPAIDVRDGRAQVIVNGYEHIGGYDLHTGEELWRLHGGGDVPVPTPIVAHDLVFVTNAHGRQAPIYAIHPLVEGEITDDPDDGHMAWRTLRFGNYMQTPLVYGDLLYACRDNGILSCHDARTGELHYRERIDGGPAGFSASCVACNDVIFITSEHGDIHILEAGPTFNIIATNSMNETCMASPAIVDGVLYYRTRGHVVAIGSTERD